MELDLAKIQTEVGRWHAQVSEGKVAPHNVLIHLLEEVVELIEAYQIRLKHLQQPFSLAEAESRAQQLQDERDQLATSSEAADIAILLMIFCEQMGILLPTAIEVKHEINLNRKWHIAEDGLLRHVKEEVG